MALNAGNEIENKASGIVVKGTAVEGGYFTIDAIKNIPKYANKTGQLCYCTGDNEFYQYNGTAWVIKEFGGGNGATPDWNQNNPAATDYIKNRIVYEDFKEVPYLHAFFSTDPNEMDNSTAPYFLEIVDSSEGDETGKLWVLLETYQAVEQNEYSFGEEEEKEVTYAFFSTTENEKQQRFNETSQWNKIEEPIREYDLIITHYCGNFPLIKEQLFPDLQDNIQISEADLEKNFCLISYQWEGDELNQKFYFLIIQIPMEIAENSDSVSIELITSQIMDIGKNLPLRKVDGVEEEIDRYLIQQGGDKFITANTDQSKLKGIKKWEGFNTSSQLINTRETIATESITNTPSFSPTGNFQLLTDITLSKSDMTTWPPTVKRYQVGSYSKINLDCNTNDYPVLTLKAYSPTYDYSKPDSPEYVYEYGTRTVNISPIEISLCSFYEHKYMGEQQETTIKAVTPPKAYPHIDMVYSLNNTPISASYFPNEIKYQTLGEEEKILVFPSNVDGTIATQEWVSIQLGRDKEDTEIENGITYTVGRAVKYTKLSWERDEANYGATELTAMALNLNSFGGYGLYDRSVTYGSDGISYKSADAQYVEDALLNSNIRMLFPQPVNWENGMLNGEPVVETLATQEWIKAQGFMTVAGGGTLNSLTVVKDDSTDATLTSTSLMFYNKLTDGIFQNATYSANQIKYQIPGLGEQTLIFPSNVDGTIATQEWTYDQGFVTQGWINVQEFATQEWVLAQDFGNGSGTEKKIEFTTTKNGMFYSCLLDAQNMSLSSNEDGISWGTSQGNSYRATYTPEKFSLKYVNSGVVEGETQYLSNCIMCTRSNIYDNNDNRNIQLLFPPSVQDSSSMRRPETLATREWVEQKLKELGLTN